MLVFVHIPSTSGSAFFNTFEDTFGKDKVIRVRHIEPRKRVKEIFDLTEVGTETSTRLSKRKRVGRKKVFAELMANASVRENLVLLGAHMRSREFEEHLHEKDQLITFLRHPVERIISVYRRRLRNDNIEGLAGDLRADLKKLARKNKRRTFEFLVPKELDPEVVSVEDAAKAIEERFDFIGFTEDRENSMKQLEERFSLSLNEIDLKSNVATDKDQRAIGNGKMARTISRSDVGEDIESELRNILADEVALYERLRFKSAS